MAQILKPKIETIISEEVVERSFRDFSTAMCNWELWLYEHKRAMRDVENDSSDADERAHAELLGFVRKVGAGRIAVMIGWRPAWQSVTNSPTHRGN
ncbi:hypothetical protein [Pseudomonas syringae]|uniref:hypothetical protein n=1 Tax=Pseudomonas syringae TaxID=317 RepID=UPI003F829E6D